MLNKAHKFVCDAKVKDTDKALNFAKFLETVAKVILTIAVFLVLKSNYTTLNNLRQIETNQNQIIKSLDRGN